MSIGLSGKLYKIDTVLLWLRCNALCRPTSAFKDDIIFARHGQYGDIDTVRYSVCRHCVVVRRLTPLLRRTLDEHF